MTDNHEKRQRYVEDSHELLDNFFQTPAEKARQLVGWTVEGHPIYSPFNSRGLLQTNLDNCNGKFDGEGEYAYYASPVFPYIMGCVGPGAYSLEEENTNLNMLPAAVDGSTRRFNACAGGWVPSATDTNACVPCPAGKYSSATYAGQKVSQAEGCMNVCPLGNYCPQGSTKPIKCPSGRYGSPTGLQHVDCSGACKAGYYCPAGSIRSDPYPCGRLSHYCPQQSPARVLVDTGFYSVPETYDESERVAQEACGPGTFCVGGQRFPCPAGRFGTTLELHTANCTDICPLGHYCPLSSPDPVICPAGTFGGVQGLETAECSGKCQPGYYCPQGSTNIDEVPCAPGRYGAEAGLTSPECSPVCESAGAGAPNATSSDGTKFCEARHCAGGYYCPLASVSDKQVECGSADVYCPPSSVLPTPVQVGYYTVGPRNDASIRFAEIICEPGYYCIAGVRHRCPLGYYGAVSGLHTDTCSGQCDAGFLCPLNSSSPKQLPCGLDASVYCPQGSYEPIEVPAGYYSVGDDHTTRGPSAECDGLCDKGYWCAEGSSSPQENDCPAGRYGHLGMINNVCKGVCRVGYYCPVNSISPTQEECGGEHVYCPHGSGSPQAVSPGYFSAGGNQTTRAEQILCSYDAYSGTPPYARVRMNKCPDTTQP
eukprot:GSChrysophyteH2.ASY1.ANO1.351.1 assembled CDS